ncbi:LysM domain-containing protein [Pyxidicoccus xibeiensis]|uniref:LysM domain-containing protein n=1 Tax=Pyxidicoccus xibeiensis TaxID=2906759 RepID=UPI0020A7437E|nr:LysM domain-containing protein [Pyxidicoccus xibeiensis]MCP3137408.1 LysM domain-containing protein [Pyxidicoccus xibeiensis]
MLELKSRYHNLETATYTSPSGRTIAYKRRRFIAQPSELLTLSEVLPVEGERLDLLAARTLGDPEQYWRICDANHALSPFELERTPEQLVRIPMPRP